MSQAMRQIESNVDLSSFYDGPIIIDYIFTPKSKPRSNKAIFIENILRINKFSYGRFECKPVGPGIIPKSLVKPPKYQPIDADRNSECPISGEIIGKNAKYSQCGVCKYNFDAEFLQKWNKSQNTCPMCRSSFYINPKIYYNSRDDLIWSESDEMFKELWLDETHSARMFDLMVAALPDELKIENEINQLGKPKIKLNLNHPISELHFTTNNLENDQQFWNYFNIRPEEFQPTGIVDFIRIYNI